MVGFGRIGDRHSVPRCPDAARYFTVDRGITALEPGRTEVPYWVTTEEDARAAVQELAPWASTGIG